MDKALKQRLVGASVLIALAVIVLPMLLGGPADNAQQQSQQIELPSSPDGASFETRRFPLASEAASSPSPSAATQSAPNEELTESGQTTTTIDEPATESAADPQVTPDATELAVSQLAQTDNSNSSDTNAVVTGLEDGSADGDMDVEGLPPVTAVEVPVSEKVDLPVEVKPVETPAKPASGGGRYAVQVASLSSEANARKLQSSLESRGYPVIADRIDSDVGRLHRLRVGPFDSEAAANAAGKKIQSQVEGVSPRTVDLDPASATQVINPSDPLVRWVVQLGSFGEAANADNLVKQVRAQGLSAYSEKVTSSSGAAINRVRAGPFLQREDAAKAQQSLKSSLSINGVVMSAE